MTREEAIQILKQRECCRECVVDNGDCNACDNAFEMAIKALEQEPCDDCISRQAVLETIEDCNSDGLKGIFCSYNDGERFKAYIKDLPSVTPKEKTGYWIDDNENEIDAQYGKHLYRCSECDKYANNFVAGLEDWWDIEKPNFCPNCGIKMVEPQESEE